MTIPERKSQLLHIMKGFDFRIDDISYINDQEMVATKMNDSDELWWRHISVEGSGFNSLFQGMIRDVCT